MPANPYKEEQLARKQIDNIFKKLPASGISEMDLARQVLLSFAVSENMVYKFIHRYYIDCGEYSINDGIITKVE